MSHEIVRPSEPIIVSGKPLDQMPFDELKTLYVSLQEGMLEVDKETADAIIERTKQVQNKIEEEAVNKIRDHAYRFFKGMAEDAGPVAPTTLNIFAKGVAEACRTSPSYGFDEKSQKEIKDFIRRCIETASGKFKRVFLTDSGSVYFETEEGPTLRVKCKMDHFSIQPMSQTVFFMAEKDIQSILDKVRAASTTHSGIWGTPSSYLIDIPLQTSSYRVGSRVVELNLFGATPAYTAITQGEQVIFHRIAECPGMHLGHTVFEIIK